MKTATNPPLRLSAFLLLSLILFSCATTQPQTAQNGDAKPPATQDTSTESSSPQLKRPVPNPIDLEIPSYYKWAVFRNTRTNSGTPGKSYWQNHADYRIDVELDVENKMIDGEGTITYFNESPDSLSSIFLELAQNLHKAGVPRNETVEVTGGMKLEKIIVDGTELKSYSRDVGYGYTINTTSLRLILPDKLAPGSSVTLNMEWSFKIPQQGISSRMGYSDGNLFFIAYWYPQMAVYDDVFGWFTDTFRGNAEFYHGFADYQVNITVPEQWLVTATGTLDNPGEVLTDPIRNRLEKASNGNKIVQVVKKNDFGKVTRSGQNGKLTWSFSAKKVNDFAFSATLESLWDAARAPVGDRDGDGEEDYTLVDAVYRTTAPNWTDAVEYARHSISFLSEFMDLPYPWPHMTSVEGGGIIGGGMEFPMITLIGSYNNRGSRALYYVIAHEFAHMWVPMIVATNERRYSWFDEGTTTFNENQSRKDYFKNSQGNPEIGDFQTYIPIAGSYLEGPIMRWSDYHYSSFAYSVASYPKPASVLVALRGLIGEDAFIRGFRTFLNDWKYKHPYPWDLFNTFERVSGQDLSWFWRSWYYETWVLDQAVESVTEIGESTRIVIQDQGQIPMPTVVEITLESGKVINRTVDVKRWLNGATQVSLTVREQSPVVKVVIDPSQKFPDVNRKNNFWYR
ncbi:MAG: M1 family metallopeptidase [Balneolaceae bacterium]|nr:M1 family metallopeptidase [Balneolaceae bacterium]